MIPKIQIGPFDASKEGIPFRTRKARSAGRLPPENNLPLALLISGALCIAVSGWLGAEMVYVKRMAVEAVEKLAKKVEVPARRRAA